MAHHHHHLGADKVVTAEMPQPTRGHERHADDRRAARAARHLHGGAADDAEGHRHQPAARVEQPDGRRRRRPDRARGTRPTGRSPINKQPVALTSLQSRLRVIFESRKEKTMFIVGAPTLRYGEIVAGDRRRQGRRSREGRHRHRRHAQGRRRQQQLAPPTSQHQRGRSG